jgi:hypothetical protein
MPFQVSPGVNVSEIDLTTIVPSVSTSIGAFAGVFRWGPIGQRILIDSETALVTRFGKPTNLNAETFFTAANFLGYTNALYVSRAANTTGSSPSITARAQANSSTIRLTTGNTSNLNTDLYVLTSTSNNVTVAGAAKILSIANSSTFTISQSSDVSVVSGSNTYVSAITINTDVNSSNIVTLSSGNTSNLAVGFVITASTNNSVVNSSVYAYITAITNSTAIQVSDDVIVANGSANVTFTQAGVVDIQFISNTAFNALANTGTISNIADQIVKSDADFTLQDGSFDSDLALIARYPGDAGNSLRVSVCGNSAGYTSEINLDSYGTSTSLVTTINSNTATITISAANLALAEANVTSLSSLINVTDKLQIGNTTVGYQYLKVTSISSTSNSSAGVITLGFEDKLKLSSSFTYTDTAVNRYWEFHNIVDEAPGQSQYHAEFGNSSVNSDELHIIIVDENGKFSGVPGTILEVYKGLSRGTDAKTIDGGVNYYKTVINESSQYIWVANDLSGATSNTAENLTSSTLDVQSLTFSMGRDGADEANVPLTVLASAYDLFQSAEDVDISLVLTGKSNGFYLANYLVDNLAETRKDCVVFCSPEKNDVVPSYVSGGSSVSNFGQQADNIIDFRSNLRSTSYSVIDSGYKYQYDRYNDIYRWIPLNGDVAGLCARTDNTNDPWWSPAGFNRGQIKNLVKLAFNPRKAERDALYKEGVNPVVTFPGQGTILFGDKTMLAKPSAFDRINVRRLFIVLEKAISTASKFTLFEFNDEFTRSQFKNLVIPYLRDVQGRRGITDFLVVCDDSNNTPEVIDRNEFVGDIYIKPARSINFIQLNFVAVRTGVQFSEIVGQF